MVDHSVVDFPISLRTVESGSMRPNMPIGSLVIGQKIHAQRIKKGDIVTFSAAGNVYTHRVVKIVNRDGKRVFYTKGDANAQADSLPVSEKSIISKVELVIPFLGTVFLFLRNPAGIAFILFVFAGIWLFRKMIVLYREERENNSHEEA
jgi:signal peptidase